MSERSVRSQRGGKGPGGGWMALTMIVKNEEEIVGRAIRSASRLVDGVIIVDTGSTDRTREVCQEVCLQLGLDCVIARAGWEGFGPARTSALQLAEDMEYDYSLVLDADDRIEATWGFEWPEYDMDAFELNVCLGDIRYSRLQVFRLDGSWYYEGRVHEHPERKVPGGWCYEPVPDVESGNGLRVIASHEGARSKNPNKWLDDAALLKQELETCDPKWRPRNQFYLAQSYRNAGLWIEALRAYEVRGSNIHGWDQERYCALLEAGRIAEKFGGGWDGWVYWSVATSVCPDRAEAFYEIALRHEKRGKPDRARRAIARAASLPKPSSGLFIEHDIYDLHIPHTYTRLHSTT